MLTRNKILIMFLSFFLFHVNTSYAADVFLTQYQDASGKRMTFSVDSSRILKLSRWDQKDVIPLSPNKVVAIVETYLAEKNKDAQIIKILLARAGVSGNELSNCWYYVVTVAQVAGEIEGPIPIPHTEPIVVLLDGTILKPKDQGSFRDK